MKTAKLSLTAALATALAVFTGPSAQAATIVDGGTITGNFAVGSAGTIGTGGYQLFDSVNPISALPRYASTTTSATPYNFNNGGGTVNLAPPYNGSSSIPLGCMYNYTNSESNLLQITLIDTVPDSFQLGLFQVNGQDGRTSSDGTVYTLTLSSDSGNPVTLNPSHSLQPVDSDGTNTFFLATITGAKANDTITIAGQDSNISTPYISGITFDNTVPEPSTWVMLLGGMGALALLRRRRI